MVKNNRIDWNEIDVKKIAANDQKEITKLFEITRPYFVWFFYGNTDLFNDLITDVVLGIRTYAPTGKFSNWVYTLAKNKKATYDYYNQKTLKRNIPIDFLKQELAYEDISATENEFKESLKQEMNLLLSKLKPEQQEFVRNYFTNPKAKPLKDRVKFCRILSKVKAMKSVTKKNY